MNGTLPHVLVVDDSEDNRGLLLQLLEDDYRVTEATNGREALAVIERDRPDLVLLDLLMPVMDGFGVLRHLQGDGGPFMPVIVVTAATEPEARRHALELGAHELLLKPLDGQELLVRVRSMLELRRARLASEARVEELEAMVAQRTRELADRNAELEAADRYKDEFLGIISHELRTPLNFIMGFASILDDELDGPLNERQRDRIARILEGSDRMLRLVENLLDVATLRSGRFELMARPTHYERVVQEVLGDLDAAARHKQVRLDVETSGGGTLIIDGPRLAKVLKHLVENAIKFTPPEGTVTVSSSVADGMLVTEVADTGPGIDPRDLAKAFETFRQLDMSSTREAGGTGLGLAIAHALVEAHGGTIGADPRDGGGTRFWFKLPVSA